MLCVAKPRFCLKRNLCEIVVEERFQHRLRLNAVHKIVRVVYVIRESIHKRFSIQQQCVHFRYVRAGDGGISAFEFHERARIFAVIR